MTNIRVVLGSNPDRGKDRTIVSTCGLLFILNAPNVTHYMHLIPFSWTACIWLRGSRGLLWTR